MYTNDEAKLNEKNADAPSAMLETPPPPLSRKEEWEEYQ